MAIKPLLQQGDITLQQQNLPITNVLDPVFLSVLQDMIDTMRSADLVGIAAPQIGENYRIFLTELRETKFRSAADADELRVFCNPEIVYQSPEQIEMYEGCGSVGDIDIFGQVSRPKEITIRAENEQGQLFELTCDGLLARVILHEVDHLQGTLFIEKVRDKSKVKTFKEYAELKQTHPEYFVNGQITKKEITYRD